MGESRHTTLGGNELIIDLPEVDLIDSFTSSGKVNSAGIQQRYCAGTRYHGDEIANSRDFGVVTFEEEYSYRGGRLRIGSSEVMAAGDGAMYVESSGEATRRWLAVWEGDAFSLHWEREGGKESPSVLLSVAQQTQFLEGPGGLALRDASGSRPSFTNGPTLAKWVPGTFSLEAFELNPRVLKQLPRWRGTSVRGGELFVSNEDTDDIYFALVGESAFTLVQPIGDLTNDRIEYLLQRVSQLDVRISSRG